MTDAPKRRGRPPKVKPEDSVEVEIAPIADFNGAELSAFDHDGDGKPGGSLPKPALPALEWAAIIRECYEAYDYQDDRLRFDTLGRKWTARLDKDGNNMVWRLNCPASPRLTVRLSALTCSEPKRRFRTSSGPC